MKENFATKDTLVQKLQALQNMTVANGCTESEALVAAGKAAELLERYGLSMQELKTAAPNQLCDENSVNCGRPRHTHEVQFLAPVVAEFTKTKTWVSRTSTEVQMTFFGLKADVQIASYLFNVFRTAMETEWTLYWAGYGVQQNDPSKLHVGNEQTTPRQNLSTDGENQIRASSFRVARNRCFKSRDRRESLRRPESSLQEKPSNHTDYLRFKSICCR
jgi:hypothetical protein